MHQLDALEDRLFELYDDVLVKLNSSFRSAYVATTLLAAVAGYTPG